MTKIEQVARAIAACQAELGPERWRYCVTEARAAIEAMRGPTPGMLKAAGTVPGYDWEDWTRDPVADHTEWWNEMIDAALAEDQ